VLDAAGALRGYRGTATDITSEVSALEQARYLAEHDALTGLPNRLLLRDRLGEALARCERHPASAAVLCLDLDGFKEVNDSLGHASGDRLLVACANRLRACAPAGDTVARQGGDEFAILQADVQEPSDVERLCRRAVDTLARPFELDGHEVLVTASIGVALVPAGGGDPERLLQHADIALYRAKSNGRNRFCFFEPGMDQQRRERRRLKSELRAALAAGQLEVHYQPQIEIGTGGMVGVEALARWRHPERGMVPPAEFVPLAEQTGLIVALGERVLRTACRDAARWPGLRVSVNVSPVQFKQRDLAWTVAEALAETGLAPERLELEVTEGLLLHDTGEALAMLERLKALGVRIALDDFGTGCSSLSYLRKFPFDKIKIDRSFVFGLADQPDGGAIVRAIVHLGQSLGIQTCAEGVETQDQLVRLRRDGCREAQGYLFGRPGPAAEIDRVLAQPPRDADAGRRHARSGRATPPRLGIDTVAG
jgi:diguanylate cyclase (GGDEF)-like protein